MTQNLLCNLCGSNNYSVLYDHCKSEKSTDGVSYLITDHKVADSARIVRCRKCGFVYADPQPSAQDIVNSYSDMIDDLYLAEEEGRRVSVQSIISVLEKYKKCGKLLDIGCATGFLLDEARKTGWNVYGIELSTWAVNYAKEKLGLKNVQQKELRQAQYPDTYFDAVILKDVIEHLVDPKDTLIEVRRILKPDGILCVNTPNVNSLISRILKRRWWGSKKAHLYYFDKRSLSMLLAETGFTPLKYKNHTRVFSTEYLTQILEGYNRMLCGAFKFLVFCKIIKKGQLRLNLGDQIEVYARKTRSIKYLDELERASHTSKKNMKVVAVLPAYNAAKTLKKTFDDIPRDIVNDIILVDDASSDNTVEIAKSLGLKVFVHERNKGYGANQKTCYMKALEENADIVVMIHPDYQYDPKMVKELVMPIMEEKADAVFGSRMMKGGALEGGMPLWKHNANILLTAFANVVFGVFLTEYHSGFRAYSAKVLKAINFRLNSDGFVFDSEIIAQILVRHFKIEEIPIKTRYFDEASTIGLFGSIRYGLGILATLAKYQLHSKTCIKFKEFK